jgi:hypothetical protein
MKTWMAGPRLWHASRHGSEDGLRSIAGNLVKGRRLICGLLGSKITQTAKKTVDLILKRSQLRAHGPKLADWGVSIWKKPWIDRNLLGVFKVVIAAIWRISAWVWRLVQDIRSREGVKLAIAQFIGCERLQYGGQFTYIPGLNDRTADTALDHCT